MVYREIKQGLIDMEAMFGLIDTPAEVADTPDARPLKVSGGHVRFENVVFAYDPARPILKGVDLDVAPGRKLAVAGHSGPGQATLVPLPHPFFDLKSGRPTHAAQ